MLNQSLLRIVYFALCISLGTAGTASAANLCATYPDPENYTWDANSTDSFGETTYTITAPCKVFVTIPFNISLTADDAVNPLAWVGGLWQVEDTPNGGSMSVLDSGFSIILDGSGNWSYTIPVTYTGVPVDHTVNFVFRDYGQGGGAHNFAGSAIGDIVVDPYPVPEPSTAALIILGLSGLAAKKQLQAKSK